ncbi:MAG: DUF4124 domain-containing protein [Methylotenera sp.]|nr:MAG: DUF4124 domain-containing protein [Methylotenera sp.]
MITAVKISSILSNKSSPYPFWMMASISLLVLATFSQLSKAEEPKRILKWKDDKGVTQYGDKIPAQYSNRENSVINQQGITVKRNKAYVYQDLAADEAKLEQGKKDRALLSAFTHEDEIDLARDRHLQLDKVTLEGLQMQKTNSQKRLAEKQKYAGSFAKQKKALPADVSADIKTTQSEITKLDQQIAERQAVMESTRKRFDEDKKRYVELKYHSNSTPPVNAAPEVTPQP